MAQSGAVERASDRWFSIVLSVLLHGALVVAVAYGWWFYKHDRPTPTLAIDAAVVDARTVPGLGNLPPQPQAQPPPPPQPPPQPQDTQPQVEPDGPPQPTPEELAKREREQKEQADREAQARQQEEDQKRLEQERQQEEALAQEKAAEEKRVEERRLAEEQAQKRAAEKAETERKEREAAEAKQREEQKRLAAEKEAEEKRQAQEKAEREADLRRSLDQELRQDAAQRSGALASWQAQITARIQRAWLKPESARPGIECVLDVTQVPGGEVTNVRIGTCNGDQAVRESIEAAVYRASPLPPPPDPSLFQRELVITFRPN
jgi:colicin import membrane protein